MTTNRTSVVMAVLTFALSTSGPACGATQVDKVLTKGRTAIAQYFQTDRYCKTTAIDVFAMSSNTKFVFDTAYETTSLFVQLFEYNSCTGTDEKFLYGSTDSFTFSIPNKLDPASASGEVVVSDSTGNFKTVRVNLRWQGGPLVKDRNRFVWVSEFERLIVRNMAAVRTSSAISGSLVVDGVDLLSPINAVNVSFISGIVTSAKGGSIDIIRLRSR